MGRKWEPTTGEARPDEASDGSGRVDPELDDLRKSLQRQFEVTRALLVESRRLKRSHQDQHVALTQRLAKVRSPSR